MSHQITKHPELLRKELKVKELQTQFKKKQSTLKSLKTRLQNMQQAIEEISRNVQTKMMHKLEKIDQLRQEIAELARKLKKSKGISREDKKALEEMANEWSSEDMLGEGYEQYKTHKEKMKTGDFDFDEDERAKMRDMFKQFQVKPEEEEQRSIRKVFLKLSQKFHPDRAKNDKEEAEFHQMMQQINDAYQKNDIHTLLELERLYLTEELDFTAQSITVDVLDTAIERLEKEIKFINNQISRTSSEIKNLRQSDLGGMLTNINKAEREGEGFSAMEAHNDKAIEMFTQLRDGLKHSIEIDAVSPKLMQMMMSQMLGDENPEIADLLEMMGLANDEDGGDFDLFDFFGTDDDDDYEPIPNPKFPIGSSVKVTKNISNALYPKMKMKNWEGRVLEAYYGDDGKPTYLIEFDSLTMKQMPDPLIESAIDEIEDFQEYEFSEKQLAASNPRDTQTDATGTYRLLFHRFNWLYLEKAERTRLQKILLKYPDRPDSENWDAHFKANLSLPFKAKTKGIFQEEGILRGQYCEVLGIKMYDPENGHIMMVQPKGMRKKIVHPFIDLKPIKATPKLAELFADYKVWAEDMLEF